MFSDLYRAWILVAVQRMIMSPKTSLVLSVRGDLLSEAKEKYCKSIEILYVTTVTVG